MVSGARQRPPHRALAIKCRNCGAGIELKDDAARMTTCGHCYAVLELTGQEQSVLAFGRTAPVAYSLRIGERLRIHGASYEVIARICFIEDGDLSEQTLQYYLYNPRRSPLFLDEYQGSWTLSHRTRVRPYESILDAQVYSFRTYDGRSWRFSERGTYEVYHVEGALPYVLKVGDRIAYAEGVSGAEHFEAERTEGEIEYGRGRAVAPAELASWLGRPQPNAQMGRAAYKPASSLPFFAAVLLAGFTVVVGMGLFVMSCSSAGSGREVMRTSASLLELGNNPMSEPFVIAHDDTLVRVHLSAPLDNAWMDARLALVENDGDTVLHVDGTDLEYYSGYDSEGRWTEGNPDGDVYFMVPDAGTYRLMLGGVSGYGEDAFATGANHPLSATVFLDADEPDGPMWMGVLALVVGLLFAFFVFASAAFVARRGTMGIAAAGALLVSGCAAGGGYLSSTKAMAPEIEHPEGISIRNSSIAGVAGASFFSTYDDPRAHLGGGLHSGK
jgi:hypothetical protein